MLRFMKRYLLPKSLMVRMQVLVVLPTLLIISLNAFIFFERHWHEVQLVMVRSVVREIAHIIDYPAPLSMQWRKLVAESLDLKIDYVQGEKLPIERRITNSNTDRLIAEQMRELVNRDFDVDTTRPGKRVYFRIALDDGLLLVDIHRKRVDSFTIRLMVGFMITSAVIFILLAALFMRKQVQPLVSLTKLIKRKTPLVPKWDGDGASPSFRYAGASEVRALTAAFADFQHRQLAALRERSAMLHGISHDLRTPLTRMKLELAMLPQTPEVKALNTDIGLMSHMLESYLEFVQSHTKEEPQRLSLDEILHEFHNRWRHRAGAVTLPTAQEMQVFQDRHQCSIYIRPQLLNRALDNLLENAMNHASHAWVSVQTDHNTVSIIFDDDGPGIPEQERELVLAAFYRIDNARQSDGGSGLGLAMVKETVILHEGKIVLDTSERGGLRVTLIFPLAA